jgi:hypothetical protein
MAQNKLAKKLESTLAQTDIAPFAPLLTPLIEQTLAESGGKQTRRGTFLQPKLVIWLVLALTLRRDLNTEQVLSWMLSAWRWLTVALPARLVAEGAITHARVRLGSALLKNLWQKLALRYSEIEPDFHGWITASFDGTTLSMPDTESNRHCFGKASSGRGESGFPLLRVVTLLLGASRVTLDLSYAPLRGKGHGERSLMRQILQRTSLSRVLFLLDAGFYSLDLLGSLRQAGHGFLMKVSRSVTLTPLADNPFHDGSYLAVARGKKLNESRSTDARRAYDPVEEVVRVIRVQVKGFRPFVLISNLLDPQITARELVRHYHARWEVELSYDEIKTHQAATLRGQTPTPLRSKRSDLVIQELYALFIVYNLTRLLMLRAAQEQGIKPWQLSFRQTIYWIREAVPFMPLASLHDLPPRDYLLQLLTQSLIDRPRRPRINPRVIKVKMSKFPKKRKTHSSLTINPDQQTSILSPPLENQGLAEVA